MGTATRGFNDKKDPSKPLIAGPRTRRDKSDAKLQIGGDTTKKGK